MVMVVPSKVASALGAQLWLTALAIGYTAEPYWTSEMVCVGVGGEIRCVMKGVNHFTSISDDDDADLDKVLSANTLARILARRVESTFVRSEARECVVADDGDKEVHVALACSSAVRVVALASKFSACCLHSWVSAVDVASSNLAQHSCSTALRFFEGREGC